MRSTISYNHSFSIGAGGSLVATSNLSSRLSKASDQPFFILFFMGGVLNSPFKDSSLIKALLFLILSNYESKKQTDHLLKQCCQAKTDKRS